MTKNKSIKPCTGFMIYDITAMQFSWYQAIRLHKQLEK